MDAETSPVPSTPTTDSATVPVAPRWRDWGLSLLLLAAAALVAVWIGHSLGSVPPTNFGLVVDAQELDFGSVWENREFPWKFTVRNPTDHDLEITGFWSSCSCAVVSPETALVPAGGAADIHLKLDLSAPFGKDEDTAGPPRLQGQFLAELVPNVKGAVPGQQPWRITGEVRRALTVTDLGETSEPLVRGQPFPKRILRVKAHGPIHAIGARCAKRGYGQVFVARSPKRAHEWNVEVVFDPALPDGPFRAPLEIFPYGPNGQRFAVMTLPLEGVILQDAQFVPASVGFAPEVVGRTLSETVTISSHAGKRFEVESIDVPDGSVRVEPVAAADATVYRVFKTVTKAGRQEVAVRFRLRYRSDGTRVTIALPIYSHGLAAAGGKSP